MPYQYRRDRNGFPRRRSSIFPGFGLFRGGFGFAFGGILLLIVVFFVVTIGVDLYANTHTKSVTFTVRDKTTKTDCNNGSCSSKYLIYTNKGVYQDTDSVWFFKFRSSDLYGNLQRGHRYTCKTAGYRIGLTSSYPNLIKCSAA